MQLSNILYDLVNTWVSRVFLKAALGVDDWMLIGRLFQDLAAALEATHAIKFQLEPSPNTFRMLFVRMFKVQFKIFTENTAIQDWYCSSCELFVDVVGHSR